MKNSQLQGQFKDFAIHTIGWQAFQDLSATIVEVDFDRTVHRVAKVADEGGDGFFYGLPDIPYEDGDHRETTLQSKHFSKTSTKLTVASLKEELRSIEKLVANDRAHGYSREKRLRRRSAVREVFSAST